VADRSVSISMTFSDT